MATEIGAREAQPTAAKCPLLRLADSCDHPEVDTSAGPTWSEAVEKADWIGECLLRADR